MMNFAPDRTRDVKDAVRKAAYEVLGEKVKIKSLTIAQRLKLLESGLHDRSVLVKKACTDRLLKVWLKDLDDQVPDLLKCLHVESSPESSVLALKALFESRNLIFTFICRYVMKPERRLLLMVAEYFLVVKTWLKHTR